MLLCTHTTLPLPLFFSSSVRHDFSKSIYLSNISCPVIYFLSSLGYNHGYFSIQVSDIKQGEYISDHCLVDFIINYEKEMLEIDSIEFKN